MSSNGSPAATIHDASYASWIVHDSKVSNRSQLQSHDDPLRDFLMIAGAGRAEAIAAGDSMVSDLWSPRDVVEARLLEAIASGDRASSMVYADWLEERGDAARAAFIRTRGVDLGIRWLAALGWIGNWGLLARSLWAAPLDGAAAIDGAPWAPRDGFEAGFVTTLAGGDRRAAGPYADWLDARGEFARAAFIRISGTDLGRAWLTAIASLTADRCLSEHVGAAIRAVDREVLALDSYYPVLPNQTATITHRPQHVYPQWVLIPRPSVWLVDDFKVGNWSLLREEFSVPGYMFGTSVIGRFVGFKVVQPATDVSMNVTFLGPDEEGAPFHAWIIGARPTAAEAAER